MQLLYIPNSNMVLMLHYFMKLNSKLSDYVSSPDANWFSTVRYMV